MNEWLKRRVLAWLGLGRSAISPPPPPPKQAVSPEEFALLHQLRASRDNTLDQILQLQQKFDALMDMWGVTVAFDPDGPAKIVSHRDNSLLADSKRYLNAALVAETLLDVLNELRPPRSQRKP